MKKAILVMFMLVIAMTTALIMTGCGSSGTSGGDSGGVDSGDAATKTLAYFNEYVSGGAYTMEMKAEYKGVTTTMTSAIKDGMIYNKSEMDGMTSIVIMKDDAQYILDPNTKSCIKMSLLEDSVVDMFSEEAANYETVVNSGSEDLKGKTYGFEEFDIDGTAVKYYFDGNELKYIVTTAEGETYTAEIVSMEKGADDSLFEIPGGYTVYEY